MRPRSWTLTLLHRPSRGRSRFRVVDLPSRDHEEAHPPCPPVASKGARQASRSPTVPGSQSENTLDVHMAVNAIEWMSHHGPVAATTLAASLEPWGKIQMTLAPPPADLPSMVNLLPTHVHPFAVIISTFFK